MSKDTIEKIDEEIQNILGEEKNIKKEKKEKEEAVLEKVVEDTEDTKKIDSITDIEDKKEVEEVVEEKVEEKKVVPEKKDSLSLTQALIVPKEKEEDKKAKVNIYLLLVGSFVILFILLYYLSFIELFFHILCHYSFFMLNIGIIHFIVYNSQLYFFLKD